MAGIFRRRGRGSEPNEAVAGEAAPGEAPLPFEPPRRGVAHPAGDRTREAAGASSPPVRTNVEDGSAAAVARLRDELEREQVEKTRALAEAERRLVRALTEQREELEAEARERFAEVARLQEELEREKAEKARVLAEAERTAREVERRVERRVVTEGKRRLDQALVEQRTELEVEARERVAEAVRRAQEATSALRVTGEELARERAEIEAELATTRRKREETERHLVALAQASPHGPRS